MDTKARNMRQYFDDTGIATIALKLAEAEDAFNDPSAAAASGDGDADTVTR
jgi:hypothetical protein